MIPLSFCTFCFCVIKRNIRIAKADIYICRSLNWNKTRQVRMETRLREDWKVQASSVLSFLMTDNISQWQTYHSRSRKDHETVLGKIDVERGCMELWGRSEWGVVEGRGLVGQGFRKGKWPKRATP